ncbi:MAG: MauE/DoxX family redox-associated membrane protein [Woeseiaceae bacterium]|nr:MauE/DoxX family redox-associated membrane protein [Woeseiaceae bacterium]
MLDPLLIKLLSISFALLFLLAAVHKLTSLATFRATLAAYQLVPDVLVAPLSICVAVFEGLLGVAWLAAWQMSAIAVASAVLLAVYTAAIAVNLLRGRIHIDCGCGMANSAGGDAMLSWGLVARNAIMIAAALAATLPVAGRSMGALDYVTLAAGLLTIVLLYAAANQLLNNGAAIGSWRNRHD